MSLTAGIVGLPNVGKSTLFNAITNQKILAENYPFATIEPNVGIVTVPDERMDKLKEMYDPNRFIPTAYEFTDIAGLVKGASLGEGLGDQFLKHIERTRVIAHVVDMGGFEGRDPYEDYCLINEELKAFNPKLMDKPQIIVANKMDIENANENLEEFKKKVKDVKIFPISAALNEGLDDVLVELANMLEGIEKTPLYEEEKFESHVLYKFKKDKPFTIYKEGNVFVVRGLEVEKLLKMTRFQTEESARRFANKLRKMGIDDELRKMGAIEGDTIRILDLEFEYKE